MFRGASIISFFPFSKLLDKDGSDVDITQPIGFDVTIIDGESAAPGIRQRAVWTNVGAVNESYNNMDDCGTITLSSFDGAIFAKATAAIAWVANIGRLSNNATENYGYSN